MNTYIYSQCQNAITSAKLFEQGCTLGAKKDDGTISKEEEKILKQIHKIVDKFNTDISKLIKD